MVHFQWWLWQQGTTARLRSNVRRLPTPFLGGGGGGGDPPCRGSGLISATPPCSWFYFVTYAMATMVASLTLLWKPISCVGKSWFSVHLALLLGPPSLLVAVSLVAAYHALFVLHKILEPFSFCLPIMRSHRPLVAQFDARSLAQLRCEVRAGIGYIARKTLCLKVTRRRRDGDGDPGAAFVAPAVAICADVVAIVAEAILLVLYALSGSALVVASVL